MLAAAVAVPGCAVTSASPRETVVEGVHSVSVSNTVRIRYQGDRLLAPLGLKVETYRREVFISGLVQNDAQRCSCRGDRTRHARRPGGLPRGHGSSRPLTRTHFRASVRDVWAATVAVVCAAGYQIEQQQEAISLMTNWRRLDPGWVNLWPPTQERMRLALYPHGSVVTVIAVADRLDEASLPWQINREENMLRDIGVALNSPAPPR